MDTSRIHDHDDTIDAHHSGLERLEALAVLKAVHACYDGYVYIGHMAVDPETGEEAEVIESIPCKRCAGSPA